MSLHRQHRLTSITNFLNVPSRSNLLGRRDQARLLVDRHGDVAHRRVVDLPEYLRPGDVVVVNDTRVLPARLLMRRSTGGRVEILLLKERGDGTWEALVRPSRRLRVGEVVSQRDDADVAPVGLEAEIGADLGEGRRFVRLRASSKRSGKDMLELLATAGVTPLPPYITQPLDDPQRYQTIYARRPVSAAAPTAGLHFTPELLANVEAAGARVVAVELAIGLDTFRPMVAGNLDEHQIHTEHYHISRSARHAIADAHRVVAIGTTVVRALETWAVSGAAQGNSDLFIRRPFDWQVIDVLLTNFHLPQSSLLCLLDAFIGPRWRALYEIALQESYRFLSFGDAMLVHRV